jgi:uncharacterized protein YaiL (DUF2058 family)
LQEALPPQIHNPGTETTKKWKKMLSSKTSIDVRRTQTSQVMTAKAADLESAC